MRFRWKLIAVALAITVALNLALYVFSRNLLGGEVAQLEQEHLVRVLDSGKAFLFRHIEALETTTVDFATWDASCQFLANPSPEFIASNLPVSAFQNLNLSLAIYFDPLGNVVYAGRYDDADGKVKYPAAELLVEMKQRPHLWQRSSADSGWSGLARLGGDLFLVSSQPVLTSREEGPPRGALLMARLLDEDLVEALQEDGGYHYAVLSPPVRPEILRPDFVVDDEEGHSYSVRAVSDAQLDGWVSLPVLDSDEEILLLVHFYRSTYLHGVELQRTLLTGTLLISLIFSVLIYIAVDKALVAREKLQRSAHELEDLSLELKTIIDGIDAPLLLISNDYMVRWANQAGAAMVGSADPGDHGKYLVDVPYVSLLSPDACPVRKGMSTGEQVEFQYRIPEGLEILARVFPLRDSDGDVYAVLLLQEDVTERVSLQRQAEQMDRLTSLGEVAAGVAHEINNPLGMIQVNLNLFADIARDLGPFLAENFAGSQQRFGGLPFDKLYDRAPLLLGESLENCHRVRRLVEDLKGFSRREELLEFEPFDVNDAIQSAVRLVQYVLRKGGNELDFDLTLPLPQVFGARHRIEQILINLLMNAHHACTGSDEPILLRAWAESADEKVVIQVVDFGCGMTPDVLKRATDPFFTTRRNDGGTGLGLSLSKRILEDHGGEMKIRSAPGEGSTISISIPIAKGALND